MGVGRETAEGDVRLFKMEVYTKKRRMVLDVIVLAESIEQAQQHVASKFTRCELRHPMEIQFVGPKHFVVGEWQTD